MRRKDREITDLDEILSIAERAKILRLGLFDGEYPYVVPLHYGYAYAADTGTLLFYLHGAREGHKLDLIRANPNACVELDCDIQLVSGGDVPCQYGSTYSSVIGKGRAEIVEDPEEKTRGLELLIKHQTGWDFAISPAMSASAAVIRITVPEFIAKSRPQKQTAFSIAELTEKMIAFSRGNVHDIDHFIRVWTYARTIGELERLDEEIQTVLEAAAIVHDIACPLCREKYGSTNGKYQEAEGAPMAEAFLRGSGLREEQIARVCYLVGHHHTFTGVDGPDYQILLEADYLANAVENGFGRESVEAFLSRIAKTESGRRLTRAMFCL